MDMCILDVFDVVISDWSDLGRVRIGVMVSRMDACRAALFHLSAETGARARQQLQLQPTAELVLCPPAHPRRRGGMEMEMRGSKGGRSGG